MSNGRNFEMRRSNNYECTFCGAIVALPADTELEVSSATDAPNMQVLLGEGL